ncbi:RND family efflux transporter MFP subunit [Altererythrobacter atlanticus]|uniref:Efflux pump periplasmic linker BepF n=1 Tax=Croceibacterium atlanticum TaxID=1267766 RepID=A0A0F7KVL9_9SPHN|nr:efflux RND transporter periplasmic adaptor subunit [Croceibacterium atlanticum]AKH42820.1 Efflux pump periplasmic linker BepF [Croceibacterium atlanticum]MBB5731600.1 RND family efflux transporter MFP subunit [Croceibacterium atlanticum]
MRISTRIAVAMLALAPLSACGESAPEQAEAEAPTGPVLVLKETDAARWTSVSAEVSTVDQAQAIARIPGILTTLSVGEGDYVKKGQVIGRIVDSQLGYQGSAYGAQAAAAQAQAVAAQAELDRAKYLHDNGVYSKARLEQARAAAEAAQAQVRAAKAQQQAVGAVAGQGAVVAPATGRVLAADIPAGSAVAPGMPIATITSGPVVLRLDLPESLAEEVNVGSSVIAEGIAGQDGSLRGTITRVYPSVTAGQVRADARIAGLDSKLIGRRVAARVESGAHKALLVPENYVTTRFGVDYVSLRSEDGQIATVPVQTAPSGEEGMVEILSGVSAGDTIVATGSGAEE